MNSIIYINDAQNQVKNDETGVNDVRQGHYACSFKITLMAASSNPVSSPIVCIGKPA